MRTFAAAVLARRATLAMVLTWLTCPLQPAAAAAPCPAPPPCPGASSGGWCVETLVPASPAHPHFTAIWSDGPDDVWAVGAQASGKGEDSEALSFHWDGCSWTRLPGGAGLNDVWGAGPRDVWAVGDHGVALHWTGGPWMSVRTGTSATLSRLSGTGGSDVWAIGRAGLHHWNGRAWTHDARLAVDARNEFLGDVWAVSPVDVWVAEGFNARGSVAHFDGTTWTVTQPSPDRAFGLFGIWSNGATTWTVGEGDQVLRRSGGSWTQLRPPSGSSQGLVNVMRAGGDLYASGQTVVHATGGGAIQAIAGVPDGSYPGLWVNGTQIWVAGSSNAGGAVVLHRAR